MNIKQFSAQKYRTLVVDPPWPYKRLPPSAKPPYALMSLEEIKHIPIPDIADTTSHLYLWVTNAFISEGFAIIKYWGFEYKTILTWAKHQVGIGSYFRNSTEHILFGLRGRSPFLRRDIRTWFLADRRQHSRKPDEFYRIVESVSPAPRIDIFSREKRPGWDQWGNQCDFFKPKNREAKNNERTKIIETGGNSPVVGGVGPYPLRLDQRTESALPQGGTTSEVR